MEDDNIYGTYTDIDTNEDISSNLNKKNDDGTFKDDTLECDIPEGLLGEDIIGIDLGTTNTCVAVWRKGNVEVIPTKSGKRTLPSVVAYTKCQRYIGDDAKNQKELNPQNVFFEVKRLIGRKINDPVVEKELTFFPYKICGDKHNNINLVPDLDNDKIYTPEEISAAVLTEAKHMASSYLNKKVTKCIITVPAHFNDGQRQATKDAAEIAGLECIRIINEPISAALAYGLYQRSQYEYKQKIEARNNNNSNAKTSNHITHNIKSDTDSDSDTDSGSDSDTDSISSDSSDNSNYSSRSNSSNSSSSSYSSSASSSTKNTCSSDDETYKHVLVYDFGGGTLDVCLLRIQNGIFTVLANSGKPRMGGSNFDTRLVSFCMSVFKKQYGYKDLANLPALSLQKLRSQCETAKKMLSTVMKTRIAVKGFYNNKDLNLIMTRGEFEKMCTDLFLEILEPVADTLDQVDMNPSDVDEVITVGGMTRMPKIRELLKQRFGKEPNCTINPDEAVACGAAIQGYLLSHKDDPFSDSIQLLDCTSLSLGVESDGGQMSVIIPRGQLIPVSDSKEYSTDKDYVSSVIIKVYEGERSIANENGNFFVGEFELCGIEPAPKGVPEIDVTFNIDANGIITVTAQNKKTFDSASMTVTSNKGRLTRDQIEALIEEAKDYEYHDELAKRKRSMYNEIDDFCENVLYNLDKKDINNENKNALNINQKDRDVIIVDIDKTINWLKQKSIEERDEEEYLKVIESLKLKYGVLILHGHIETTNELKDAEEAGNRNGVTVYGNDDDDDNEEINKVFEKIDDEEKGYKGMSNIEKEETKELRQGVFDLCYSVLDILDSNNLQISTEHIKELKEFVDDSLMWMHIHEKPTKAEYKLKIDSINDMCDKIFNYYQNEGVELFKENEIVKAIQNPRDELENLCIVIKLLIVDKKIPLEKEELNPLFTAVNDTLDWIFKNDVILEKERVNGKLDEEFIKTKLETFYAECIEKQQIVNDLSDTVNQKINGLNLENFTSTICPDIENVIVTGYDNINNEPNVANSKSYENTESNGTSILELRRRMQKDVMSDMISDTAKQLPTDNANTDNLDDLDDINNSDNSDIEDIGVIN